MHRPLANKKILITAGPTWVPIDKVRVISNCSSGATGLAIAEAALKAGADVTLLLGPVHCEVPGQFAGSPRLKILRFKYFDELRKSLLRQIKRRSFDVCIHAAAVSDYRPARPLSGKIRSGRKKLSIVLRPTPKMLHDIRRYAPSAFLVMFKLETGSSKRKLIDAAYAHMIRSEAGIVVANAVEDITGTRHRAYIIDREKTAVEVSNNKGLAATLLRLVGKELQKGRIC